VITISTVAMDLLASYLPALPEHPALPALPRPLCVAVGGAALLYGLNRAYGAYRMRKLRDGWAAHEPSVVVVHLTPRPYRLPSLTPFGIKLETFLRLTGIEYVVDFEEPMGPKGKNPWITMGGQDYSDSQFIAEMLMEKFKKNPDANLTKEQKAISLAMRLMFEEHLYWGAVSWRYAEDRCRGMFTLDDFPLFVRVLIKMWSGKAKKWLYGQGMGRHSVEEIHQLVRRDMQAFTDYLGDKLFLLGEEPHVDDCAVFAFLTEALYGLPDSYIQRFVQDTPTLMAYVERMKKRFWPDWDQCVKQPKA